MADRRDMGKLVRPPADATHCGGYPVTPPPPAAELTDRDPQYLVFALIGALALIGAGTVAWAAWRAVAWLAGVA